MAADTVSVIDFWCRGYAGPVAPCKEGSCDLDAQPAANMLTACETADILISHSPPKGHVDVTSTGLSLGSTAVLEAIERIAPPLVLCGHIHDCWGQSSQVGPSKVVNLGPTGTWFDIEPSA